MRSTSAQRALDAFLELYWSDWNADSVRSLSDYLARFPGHEELIAREYLALEEGSAVEPPSEIDAVGTERIGPYRILHELDRGGQAVVYRARDERLSREVALKLFRLGLHLVPATIERIRREAEVASRVEHPGLCTVYDVGSDGDQHWIAMQLVDGRSLAERIDEARAVGHLDLHGDGTPNARARLGAIARLIERVARAVHAVHEAGVVHRDLKPNNIAVRDDGRPIVLDYGLALVDELERSELTADGDSLGTPAYMSPEQVTGSERVDRRTDVWALGVTMFECITLSRPFDAPTRAAVYQKILAGRVPEPRHAGEPIPEDLRVILGCAMERDRGRRYATALDLADDLRRFRSFEPIRARPAGPALRLRRWAQRNPLVASVSLAATLAVLVALALVAAKNRELTGAYAALQEQEEDIRSERDRSRAALADVSRLKARRTLADLERRADRLWPALPERLAALSAWLEEADALVAELPAHRALLDRIEATADPYSDADRARDHAAEIARLAERRRELARLRAAAREDRRPALDHRIASLEREVAAGESLVAQRGSWTFSGAPDPTYAAWLHGLLADLVRRLTTFAADGGVLADVRERARTATRIGDATLVERAAEWDACRARVRDSECYGGLTLAPQVGLIPLGPDPRSGLEEFLHWASHADDAPLPVRDDAGRVRVTEDTGIVLVLLPGGAFRMGASKPTDDEPSGPHVDRFARETEGPPHDIALDPFFVSKFEITQAQWQRMMRAPNPSSIGPERHAAVSSVTHPVEFVDWHECVEAVRRMDLDLPSEAQWEYAARGGTTTVWPSGDEVGSLTDRANVADATARELGMPFREVEEAPAPRDGFALHAPVDALEPNGFGLHHTGGNVWEWCKDAPQVYAVPARPGDGLRPGNNESRRNIRGGSWQLPTTYARSAARDVGTVTDRQADGGLRPVREVRGR